MVSPKKLIILDRDGVINFDSQHFIKTPEEWIPIPGSLEAITELNRAGFTVVVATNQSGIARGLFTRTTLEHIHQKIIAELALKGGKIDGFYICPHGPLEACACRKPKPGLIHQIAKTYDLNLKKNPVYCIGDSLRDLEAATAAFCIPILVGTGNGQKTRAMLSDSLQHTRFFSDLNIAIKTLLQETDHHDVH